MVKRSAMLELGVYSKFANKIYKPGSYFIHFPNDVTEELSREAQSK